MNILIVDDEALARRRLRTLLQELPDLSCRILEAAAVSQAQELLARMEDNAAIDIVLLDIQMPGMDGVQFAQSLRTRARAPAVIFVTAHPEYATRAFDVQAVDYLTKPVRSERLHQALTRACQWLKVYAQPVPAVPLAIAAQAATAAPAVAVPALPGQPAQALQISPTPQPTVAAAEPPFLIVSSHNRTERVLLEHIVLCRAEMKYITLVTPQGSLLFDGSLNDLEKRFAHHFLRVHRNALVARSALRGLLKAHTEQEGEHWRLQLHGTHETVQVSRRLLPSVRAALQGRPGA